MSGRKAAAEAKGLPAVKEKEMQLSKRLRTIVDMTMTCRIAADIGTDHGFVPMALLREKRAEKCIAADIRTGPLERAREHIAAAGLQDSCEFRLGPGLQVLAKDEAELIIIAGMGGLLIRDILLEGKEKLGAAGQLVLSPHTEVPAVRRTLETLDFHIEDEAVVLEEEKFYTVISALPGAASPLSEEELLYGPVLLKKRPRDFLRQLDYRIRREEEILEKIRLSEKEGSIRAAEIHEQELLRLQRILKGYPV